KERKRKAARACLHCQRAHVTCDDSRPCQRCIKNDRAHLCQDGQRRRAKYLLDDDEVEPPRTVSSAVAALSGEGVSPTTDDVIFGSVTANQEYEFLTTMLANAGAFNPLINQHSNQPQHQQSVRGSHNRSSINNSGGGHRSSHRSLTLSPYKTAFDIYTKISEPHNHVTGFHYLIKWVERNMVGDDKLRIARALAQIRPSFIALVKNLTHDDLVFTEKCFQRTLMEFEQLVSLSGTPTVIWRRTGEMALVGKEFTLLTGWSREYLLNEKKYIFELMDKQSAVEYWELFAGHAFDGSEQSVMSQCTLIAKSGAEVRCAFCFTIRRDLFDIPLAVIGNFLPIL
ncbi:hypothetical protein GQ42DRAFT_112351, partial [Ramicandelaber brevisporus]